MLILLPNRLLLTGLSVLLFVFSKSTASGSSADDEKEMANYVKALRKELFQTRAYDPTISPYLAYADSLQATNISLGLDLFYVIDLDTSTSILEATFVLKLGWINENLTWVPDRFGGLELLHIAAGEVFRPDIYVSNALAEENLVSSSSHSDMLLSAEGELFWAPVITLRTLCPLDLTDWPSDRQTCLLRFVSGSFFTTEVLLFNSSKHIETGNLKPNPQWAVVATGVHFRSVSYYDLVFELTLQRTSDVFAWAISVPLYAALCLNLGTFFFSGPLCSSVVDFRFSLVRLAFLTLILLSLYVASQLGGVVGVLGMPTLVAFIGRNTVLVTVNLLWSAFLRSSSSSSSSSSSPKAPTDLLSRALRPLERLLGGGGGGGVDDSERLVEEVDELPSNPPPQRKEVDINGGPSRVVHLLDKLLFVVSLAVMFFR